MVVEQFLDRKVVTKHFPFVFVISALNVFIAAVAQSVFFPGKSLGLILFVTLLLVPSLHHLMVLEEKLERRGTKNFFKKHSMLIKLYLGAFLGLLLGFLIMGNIQPDTMSYQADQLKIEHLNPLVLNGFANGYHPTVARAMSLFTHNLWYLIVGFIVSIFYGAGAVVLVSYNASFFAAFVLVLLSELHFTVGTASVALLHLIPETLGFICAAIAGGTLSRALIREKFAGKAFKNVLRNDFLILIIGIAFVLLAAFLETYVTAPVFASVLR